VKQKSYSGAPTLYLVPTPIGNLGDITIRAIDILKEVEVIFSEDKRETIKILQHFQIKKNLLSCHEHNEEKAKNKIIEYLENGFSVALVTDRGTPIISDPGFKCATYAIEKGYNVVGLPGATAFVPALITSGISPSPFIFYGFLDSKKSKRRTQLKTLSNMENTMIFYESPHRILDTLSIMVDIFGDRKISISREISKVFEEIYRGAITDIITEIKEPRGEYVIVVEGNNNVTKPNNLTNRKQINLYLKEGYNEKTAIKKVSKERGLDKNAVYKEYHARK
jgi:16S rRNA (cytidine1402-2'-O)-methyltransferase